MNDRFDLPADLETRLVEVLESDGGEQPAAIEALCADRPEHAQGIRAFVAAARLRSVRSGSTASDAFAGLAGRVGSFGPFRVVEQLARGGMGVVYLAEQDEPVRRKVALKVMDQRARDPEFAARFRVERAALALLQHPHIARVLHAGTTDGAPWLAIEFVASRQTITQYCDEQRLSVRERLELFLLVCDAVQHAHSRGILHRDLKPANVLVDTSGRTPSPKVIDFGIAKMLGGGAVEAPFATRAGALLGTSVYMSPEQVRGNVDLDTRTDVYALGGLLHELLTGEYPGEEHDLAELFQHDLPRFLEIVTKVPLSPPSKRAAARGDRGARAFGIGSARLVRALRGDLDAIVLGAMAKARERRYDSASALARDVERHLRGEPVEALGPGLGYRLQKIAARHAVVLGIAAAFVVLAVAGVVWVLDQNAELSQINRELEREQQKANAAIDDARASEQRALAMQRESERERTAAEQARAQAVAAGDEAEQARGDAEAAADAARSAEASVAAQARQLRDEADAADQARMALADVLADENLGGGKRTVAALTDRLAELLDRKPALWPAAVERELRQSMAWLLWGLGSYDQARAQFELLAALPADNSAQRLERAAALHALADAVSQADPDRNIEHLREAVALLRAEQIDERDPRLLRVEGDLGFQLLQTGSIRDQFEGFGLIKGTMSRALGCKDENEGLIRLFALLPQLAQVDASAGFDGAVEQLDRFLAPILEESMLRSRLGNILVATAMLPQVAGHRPLVLRCALHYGERCNGRGHPDTTAARLQLAAAIARDDRAPDVARQRELLFRLCAEQADIDRGFGRDRDRRAAAEAFAAKVSAQLATDAPAEFRRIAALLRPECHADNPILALLVELGRE